LPGVCRDEQLCSLPAAACTVSSPYAAANTSCSDSAHLAAAIEP
jgi:hypothetical protein